MKIFLISLFFTTSAFAVKFKVGVLAPEGTAWSKNLKKMAKEIKKETKGKVKFKFYFGGAQGDEPDVLRKIRVGQLQGGVFTGKTLGEIDGNVRLMELPFNFGSDRKKAWNVLQKMSPTFTESLEKKKFVSLGFFEIGMVYFVSVKPVKNLKDLKSIKIWSWAGDTLVEAMVSELNLLAVPLPLPDVLGSLSTGIIDGAYAPPLGIMALQWNSKIKYLVDLPLSYSVGAMLLSKKKWAKLDKNTQDTVLKISHKYVSKVNQANMADNAESLRVLKESGVKFLKFPDKDTQDVKVMRNKMLKTLTGKLFEKKTIKLFNKYYQ